MTPWGLVHMMYSVFYFIFARLSYTYNILDYVGVLWFCSGHDTRYFLIDTFIFALVVFETLNRQIFEEKIESLKKFSRNFD